MHSFGRRDIIIDKTSQKRVPAVAQEHAREARRLLNDGVRRIVLFGSQARWEGTAESNYDSVILAEPGDREAPEGVRPHG
jgi:predicted nucleotidyltransferase